MGSLLLAAIAMLTEGKLPKVRTAAGALLVVFTAVLVMSSLGAVDPDASFERWGLYFSWVLVYLLVTNIVTTEKRFFVFMLAFLLYSFKMSQHGFRTWAMRGFSFEGWGVTGAPGWFMNSGEFGIQMCVVLPLVVEFILALRSGWSKPVRWISYLVPVTIVGSIIGSSSRGALIGAAAVALWWIARSRRRFRTLATVGVLALVVWWVVPEEQKARFAAAGEDPTSVSRLERWEAGVEIANDYPLFGIGYNNWVTFYGPAESHNIFIQAWAELGYMGLLAFLGMIVASFWVNARTRRVLAGVDTSTPFLRNMAYGLDGALIGFLVSGFFVTVLYYPYFWVNLAMTVALHTTAINEAARQRKLARRILPGPPENAPAAPFETRMRPSRA
jgi:O-antigen ligase